MEGLLNIKMFHHGDVKESDQDEIRELSDAISTVIYEEKIQLEKIIFLNRTLFFLNKYEVNMNGKSREERESVVGDAAADTNYLDETISQSDEETEEKSIFDCYDSDTLVGMVLNIENDFIGQKGFEYLKKYLGQFFFIFLENKLKIFIFIINSKSNRLEKLTNEVIKCKEIKKLLLKQDLRDKFIRNLSLDLMLIKEVNFSRYQLSSLDHKAFASFTNLNKINLRKNQLNMLNIIDLFSGLINLQEINLYSNKLEFLYTEVFKGLTNLKKLDLSDNKLQVLDCNTFKG